jgi:hypothetical protein
MSLQKVRTPSTALVLSLLLAAAAAGQDAPPPATPPPDTPAQPAQPAQPPPAAPQLSPEDEAKLLREAAEEEATGPAPAGPTTPEDDLRRSLNDEVQDSQSTLYRQLVDSFNAIANRANSFNPRLTVSGDFLGRLALGPDETVVDGVNVDDRIALREGELDLRADVDPYAKGVLILAVGEDTPGSYGIDIEEGYITLEALPWRLHAQLGRARMPFGRMNALHTHDLPQATRPYALNDLFGGDEGLVEDTAILSWLAPKVPLELKAAVLNGENKGLFAGSSSNFPAFLGRAEYFVQLTQDAFVSVGTSYLYGFNDAPDPVTPRRHMPRQESQVWGADLLAKWSWNELRSIVFQGEVFTMKKERAGRAVDHAFGAYAFAQVQPFDRWYFGARYDWSNYDEQVEGHRQWAASGWVSFYTTEFLRFRLGYEHRERQTTDGGKPDNDTLFFEITFVFGSHPAEPFWVNR